MYLAKICKEDNLFTLHIRLPKQIKVGIVMSVICKVVLEELMSYFKIEDLADMQLECNEFSLTFSNKKTSDIVLCERDVKTLLLSLSQYIDKLDCKIYNKKRD